MTDLTEQWKKGEFIVCNAGRCQYYYVQNEKQQDVIKTEYCLFDDNTPNWKILAPVPSYDEYMTMKDCAKKEFEAVEKYTKVKELLKECVKMNTRLENALWQWNEESKLYDENEALENKINEVLNA